MKDIVARILPNLTEADFDKNFSTLGIDSMDLVSLRVDVESRIGRMIPNRDWLGFRSLNDILNYNSANLGASRSAETPVSVQKSTQQNFITMPQMTLEGLSENWLFKEAGDLHWDLLCKGLGTDSSDLKDDVGNRLYATFVRIRVSGSHNLADFKENAPYEFDAELSRYGLGMFFSKIGFNSEGRSLNLEMMTSFSVRKSTGDNKSLAKSQPNVDDCTIPQAPELPVFGNEYRLVKKGELNTVFFKDTVFNISDEALFTNDYLLNPYYDLNGVGLLYFASYPVINDFCALPYLRQELDEKWEENYFTIFRDVMYYANCDAQDTIIFTLNSVDRLADNRVKMQSTLHRKSDGKMMARIFTIKQKRVV